MRDFTTKQRRFIEAYSGNTTQAAADAGYSGNRKTLEAVGHKLLANTRIAAAIRKREEKRERPLIANREERQRFWSTTLRDPSIPLNERLRASELLGKSELDFGQRLAGSDGDVLKIASTVRFVDADAHTED